MKRCLNKIFILLLLICFPTLICGCWDYTEMNDLKYVAGFAIDKDKNSNEYILTFEVLEASVSAETINSNIVESRGKTIHAALRNAIKKTGKMLQTSHAKVVIISKDIAEEGIVPVLDLINRDEEVRSDMWLLISKMSSASEILTKEKISNEIISYDLADTIKNSNKTGRYVSVEVFKFIKDLSDKGMAATASMVNLVKQGEKSYCKINGIAVFKKDKMIGELNENDTLSLQILKSKDPKFVIPIVLENNESVSLEVTNINRKLKAKNEGGKVDINMNINIDVRLSELAESEKNYIYKSNRYMLEKYVNKSLETDMGNLLNKLQNEYRTDIVGFGDMLKRKNRKLWIGVEDQWNEVFSHASINTDVNVNIKYSGLTKNNIKVGE